MLGIRTITWRYYRTQGQKLLGEILKTYVATATWRQGFVDHYSAASKSIYIKSDLIYQNRSLVFLLEYRAAFMCVFLQITVWLVIQVAFLSFLESAIQGSAVHIFIGL
jgi:hypothetical protein